MTRHRFCCERTLGILVIEEEYGVKTNGRRAGSERRQSFNVKTVLNYFRAAVRNLKQKVETTSVSNGAMEGGRHTTGLDSATINDSSSESTRLIPQAGVASGNKRGKAIKGGIRIKRTLLSLSPTRNARPALKYSSAPRERGYEG